MRMIGRMELAGVSGWVSRYVEMWAMRGAKEVPPPPVRWKEDVMDSMAAID